MGEDRVKKLEIEFKIQKGKEKYLVFKTREIHG